VRKLSELIHEGSQCRPQGFNGFVQLAGENDEIRTCAIGAAMEAVASAPTRDGCSYSFHSWESKGYTGLREALGIDIEDDDEASIPYPPELGYKRERDCILEVVAVLNDEYKWTREKIADYLESIGY